MDGFRQTDELHPTIVYTPVAKNPGTVDPSGDPTVGGTHIINPARQRGCTGRRVGQYHLKRKLGTGGMGEVYEAEHLLLKRPCAVKLIRQERSAHPAALASFEREVRAAAKLTHWNAVQIYDYGHTDDGTFYYVMELLPGLSLRDLVRRYGPLPPERAIHFLRQTCNALREAHAVGLIHRDIKPANIFAAKRGGVWDVAKLLDFGLVKEETAEEVQDAQPAGRGGFSGSPLYASPEQATEYSYADARSDLYSLGAVAYYVLTGRPPFSGKNLFDVILAHSRDEVVPPSQVQADIPADVEQVVLRCLRKDARQRFQDAGNLQRALDECGCADKWTQAQAAAWWQSIEATQPATIV